MTIFLAIQCKYLVKKIAAILECAIKVSKYYRPDKKKIKVSKTAKYEGLIVGHYLEELNPLGSGRWPNSTIILTQIRDGGPTR
jgi:hypothetical protein